METLLRGTQAVLCECVTRAWAEFSGPAFSRCPRGKKRVTQASLGTDLPAPPPRLGNS